MIQGTFNQIVKASASFGGSLVVFEGHPQLLVGGFKFDLADLPEAGQVLPCGTPVYCDETNRTIVPIITAKVESVDSDDATKVTLVGNGFNGPALKVGSVVAVLNATITTQYSSGSYATVTAIDGNEITLSAELSGLAANDILVDVAVNSTTSKAAIKATPNALLPYDVVRDANAISVDGDGMIGNDRPVLLRRMPPVNDGIIAAIQANGHKITFSNRK